MLGEPIFSTHWEPVRDHTRDALSSGGADIIIEEWEIKADSMWSNSAAGLGRQNKAVSEQKSDN